MQKIAIIHNYMDNIGGAEIFSLTLAKELGADIISTSVDRTAIHRMGFDNVRLRSIGNVPINPPWRQQKASCLFRFAHFSGYDRYIVAGDWAMSALVRNHPNIWYVQSPIRELWDLYEYTRRTTVPLVQRPLFDVWVRYNRMLNRRWIRHADKLLCNSKTTQRRLKKYLAADATVVYPPIYTDEYSYHSTGDFWLSVNRLLPMKRVEIQMKAFAKMPEEKLVIVGAYEQAKHFKAYVDYLKSIKPSNVTLMPSMEAEKLRDLYSRCKGFITTSKNEDFGLTAIEAMASGKPVIAPDEGGYRESVVDGVTGKLIKSIDPDKLVDAVLSTVPKHYTKACIKQSMSFDVSNFMSQLRVFLESGD